MGTDAGAAQRAITDRRRRRVVGALAGLLAVMTLLTPAGSAGAGLGAGAGPATPAPSGDEGGVTGTVVTADGAPVAGIVVDLFAARLHSSDRADYVGSTRTDAAGRYRFAQPDGCYVVVVVAPGPATFAAGSPSWQQPVCLTDGHQPRDLVAELGSGADESSVLSGTISHHGGAPAPALTVQVFGADGAGGRGPYLQSVQTDGDGRFRVTVTPGCRVVVVAAPDGDRFVDGGIQYSHLVCGAAGRRVGNLDATLASSGRLPSPLSPVEREILRLTNELRADPSGPLARRASLPSCVGDRFYGITVDPATGHPTPAPALTPDEAASVRMARAWAAQMQRSGRFEHRSSTSQQDLYSHLGLTVSAWGENIAWFTGYDLATSAQVHFEGWRESETGHYCSMLSPRFTRIGVGEVSADTQSWAVQNFYR